MIEVLDHGHVGFIESFGDDSTVLQIAKNIIGKGDDLNDQKCIDFLIKTERSSLLNPVMFNFEIKAPLFVLERWYEYSYKNKMNDKITEEFYTPSEFSFDGLIDLSKDSGKMKISQIRSLIFRSNQTSYTHYSDLINFGIPNHLAEMILPSSHYKTVNTIISLPKLLNFKDIENSHECSTYSDAVCELIKDIIPLTLKSIR